MHEYVTGDGKKEVECLVRLQVGYNTQRIAANYCGLFGVLIHLQALLRAAIRSSSVAKKIEVVWSRRGGLILTLTSCPEIDELIQRYEAELRMLNRIPSVADAIPIELGPTQIQGLQPGRYPISHLDKKEIGHVLVASNRSAVVQLIPSSIRSDITPSKQIGIEEDKIYGEVRALIARHPTAQLVTYNPTSNTFLLNPLSTVYERLVAFLTSESWATKEVKVVPANWEQAQADTLLSSIFVSKTAELKTVPYMYANPSKRSRHHEKGAARLRTGDGKDNKPIIIDNNVIEPTDALWAEAKMNQQEVVIESQPLVPNVIHVLVDTAEAVRKCMSNMMRDCNKHSSLSGKRKQIHEPYIQGFEHQHFSTRYTVGYVFYVDPSRLDGLPSFCVNAADWVLNKMNGQRPMFRRMQPIQAVVVVAYDKSHIISPINLETNMQNINKQSNLWPVRLVSP
ncbi:MAG TPA: hypothetical protein VEF04_07145, partial [Blastocatellia bacterium]|nr:hypothetical protein [Blastocatellia bacterium]